MLCDKCKQNEATSHFHSVVNGVVHDSYFCSECAAKVKNKTSFDGDIFKLLSSMLGNSVTPTLVNKRCDGCGISFEEISRTGRVGCGKCYETFKTELEPTLVKIHGRTTHVGKRPLGEPTEEIKDKNEDLIETLGNQLKAAIENEEYEKAAVIRDQIKRIKEEQ
jgi:protein arginine kinase activator